jgi:hypothetical protein
MSRVDTYEGEHILARFDRGRFLSDIMIRNKDNICSATVAHNQKRWGAGKVWDEFVKGASKETSFGEATSFFESHGISMRITG